MKYITLLLVLLPLVKSLQQGNSRVISVDFDKHDKNYNINLMKNSRKKCGSFESLNLDNMNLRVIKNGIIQSNNIQHISLQNNHLENVYTILDHVPNLSCLSLSGNNINIYNGNVIRHRNLKILDLSYQKTSQSIFYYSSSSEARDLEQDTNDIYRYIIFNNTGISLPNLQYLDLSGNDISALMWNFNTSFPQLIQLDLTNIKAIELEPTFFEKVPKSLRVLHMENNYLHNLTLQNMAEVTALYLDGNQNLRIINIVSKKLKILSLSNCTNLGHGTFDIPYLEQLDLSRNNFQTVSTISFKVFQSLQILLLDYNKLTQIPSISDLQQLNELSLSFNMIRYIPSDIFAYFPSLKKLSLRGNRIENIDKDAFLGLNNLEYLNLSDNKLKLLPYNWATALMSLQYLNANSNQFANVLDIMVTSVISLKHLAVYNNTFTEISEAKLSHLPGSTTVYLH